MFHFSFKTKTTDVVRAMIAYLYMAEEKGEVENGIRAANDVCWPVIVEVFETGG